MSSIILQIKNKQLFLPKKDYYFSLNFSLGEKKDGVIIFSAENGFINKKVTLSEIKPKKTAKDLRKSFFYKIEEK